MDRSWINIPDKLSSEYTNGIEDFISVTKQSLDAKGMVVCPCTRCVNKELQNLKMINLHLLTNGFLSTYKRWYYHGELAADLENKTTFDSQVNNVEEEHDDLASGLNDTIGSEYFDIGPTGDFDGDSSFNVSDKYNVIFESLHKPLYDNCKYYVLKTVVKLMNIKVLNKLTDNGFDDILKCFKDTLPEGNHCPENYCHTRKLLCEVGLGYEQIDVYQYDCALFYGENVNDISCPVCKCSRYVRNKIPHKRLRWFPVKARLKRLFSSKHTSKDMRWHKEVRKEEPDILRHPADGIAWKHFDNIYPDFAIDSRSVRTGLASDGFNPFSNLSSSYSLWPVILIPYNMPPWASPNGTNYLMSLLIPCLKSPGKDYDVFLQPLIKELKELWHGIDAYDSYGGRMFKLKAAVLWTISDFPAYAYLSGWSTAGKLACPVFLKDTRSRRITDKQCFTGHRCYLSANHSWRRSKDYDGSSELSSPPRTFTREDILKQLEEVHVRTPGKAPNNSSRKHKRGANELNWSKRSVLFDLPYWSTLLLQHNLDVMHIEKNICDNIVGTLLDIEGKTKDNLKARKDLQDLNIHEELWLKKTASNKYEKPHASYTFTREECKSFCQFIRTVLQGGPVAPRWMFGTERHMGLFKRYVRNMARLDGSIAKAFVVDEAVSFLTRYVSNIETKFTKLERNWDSSLTNHKLEVFNSSVRLLGAASIQLLQSWKSTIQCDHKKILQVRGISHSNIDDMIRSQEEEDESVQLPPFRPVEDSIDCSSLVRRDVAAVTLTDQLVADLFSRTENQHIADDNDLEGDEENEIDDDGYMFLNNEELCSSDDDNETSSEMESDA
ncbi:hypothetical protein AgCh_000397 [Apium graveolens]